MPDRMLASCLLLHDASLTALLAATASHYVQQILRLLSLLL